MPNLQQLEAIQAAFNLVVEQGRVLMVELRNEAKRTGKDIKIIQKLLD